MSRQSKRETAPPPLPFTSSSPSVHRAPPASMKPTPRSTASGPGPAWWCGTPVPQQAAPSSAASTWWSAANSSVQKDGKNGGWIITHLVVSSAFSITHGVSHFPNRSHHI